MSTLTTETLAKLTTALAGETELYNEIINHVQTNGEVIAEKDNEIKTMQNRLDESETRGQQYLGQITNLLSKIPMGETNAPQSLDAKMEEIKNRSWSK